MGLREELKKFGDNAKDAVNEAGHRSQAEAERENRELNGDLMTPGEKAGSVANEAKHDVLADVDKAKRSVRNNT
ncbi:MAG: hypothetical protein ACLPYS_19720 [Vulcanimicrobiaceae bacterium]